MNLKRLNELTIWHHRCVTRKLRPHALVWVVVLVMGIAGKGFAWDASQFKKPSVEELKSKLSALQFEVTQNDATEPPFKNAYHDSKAAGIYVDVVSGEPLFSSLDKFDSGTGWPSFTKPLEEKNVKTALDFKLVYPRSELRSVHANSHLGHVFDDGPAPTGKRYCINSAALRFVAAAELEKEGYAKYVSLFLTSSEKGSASSAEWVSSASGPLSVAYFAAGCFWCAEADFEKVEGVVDAVSGFMGGTTENPTYKLVSEGKTDHAEAVQVKYDAAKVSYQRLLNVFWPSIDPTAKDRQFCDSGKHYRSAIFYSDSLQEKLSKESLQILKDSKRFETIHTEVLKAGKFYPAEDEHQNFYKTNTERYTSYRAGCGRDRRTAELWAGFKGIFSSTE